jgi:hypothetical protein
MPGHDDLKALIHQLPDVRLDAVAMILQHHINTPAPKFEIEHMQQRSRDERRMIRQRFHEKRKPGILGTGGCPGFSVMREGVPGQATGFSLLG